MSSYIEFQNVYKRYYMGDSVINAANNVSFNIEKGEFAIILGASGAGKTTVLNLLGGIDLSDEGRIIVDERVVSGQSENEMIQFRRMDIGFVFQFYNLIQNLTAKENVELAVQVCPDHLDVDEVMDSVGLGERKNNFPAQLSGGEQQRVAIARALAKNPKLLLCDEPTGALDYETGKQVLIQLESLTRDYGRTVVIVTHTKEIGKMADRVIRVRSGKIVEEIINESPVPARTIDW